MKQRIVYDTFWTDENVSELSTAAKLLFLYFLTNTHINLIGVYHCPLAYIVQDTGLQLAQVKNGIEELVGKQLVFHYKDSVIVINYCRYQNYSGQSIMQACKKAFKSINESVLAFALSKSTSLSNLYQELYPDEELPEFADTESIKPLKETPLSKKEKQQEITLTPAQAEEIQRLRGYVANIQSEMESKRKYVQITDAQYLKLMDSYGDLLPEAQRRFFVWYFEKDRKPNVIPYNVLKRSDNWVRREMEGKNNGRPEPTGVWDA